MATAIKTVSSPSQAAQTTSIIQETFEVPITILGETLGIAVECTTNPELKTSPLTTLGLHGFAHNKRTFENFFKAYSDQVYRQCAFDMPGHGGSEPLTGMDLIRFGLAQETELTQQVIKGLQTMYGIKITDLIGHSKGGLTVPLAIARHPELKNTIRGAFLDAPAPPEEALWLKVLPLLKLVLPLLPKGLVILGDHPELRAPHVEIPHEVYRQLFLSDAAGKMCPDAASISDGQIDPFSDIESPRTLTQLAGFHLSRKGLGRINLPYGILAGLTVAVVGSPCDGLMSLESVQSTAAHLQGKSEASNVFTSSCSHMGIALDPKTCMGEAFTAYLKMRQNSTPPPKQVQQNPPVIRANYDLSFQ